MIEIRTITEYKDFLSGLPPAKLDNFMTNFIFAFSQIGVGCNCRRKMRIRATEERKLQSISNMSRSNRVIIAKTPSTEIIRPVN